MKSRDEIGGLEIVFTLIVGVGLCVYSPLVTRDAWNWFVAPLFGLPLLTWKQVFLLGLFVALFRMSSILHANRASSKETKESGQLIGKEIGYGGTLGIAHFLFWWLS